MNVFYRSRKKVTTIERDREKEEKKFQSQNLAFDYNILTRIKEEMVDVSSSCIEMALKESNKQRKRERWKNSGGLFLVHYGEFSNLHLKFTLLRAR